MTADEVKALVGAMCGALRPLLADAIERATAPLVARIEALEAARSEPPTGRDAR